MLEFKFENSQDDFPYHYRCKHFSHDDNGVSLCSVYDFRPRMCRDFPFYSDIKHLDRVEPVSPYEGCGYNEPD